MNKNWIVFIVICVATYGWMFSRQMAKDREYKQAVQAYLVDWASWEAKRAEAEARKEEARRRLQEGLAPGTSAVNDGATSGTQTADATIPKLTSADRKELYKQLLTAPEAPLAVVDTPLYYVVVSTLGARPIEWDIKSAEAVQNVLGSDDVTSSGTVPMISRAGDPDIRDYPLQFVGPTVRDYNGELFTFARERSENTTKLTFTSDPVHDMVCVKEFLFRDDSYVVDLTVRFENGPETRKPLGRDQGFGIGWQAGLGDPTVTDRSHPPVASVVGGVETIRALRLDRDDTVDTLLRRADWAGLEKKYFAAIIVPSEGNPVDSVRTLHDRRNDSPEYAQRGAAPPLNVELMHPPREIAPGETVSLAYQLYVGPKSIEALKSPAFVLSETAVRPADLVFHEVPLGLSFLRGISILMLNLMRKLHEFLGAWGFAIIATTIVVRILIYPLTHWAIKNQARTMIEQQRMRPDIEAINKKFKSDPMKKNQAMMALWKEHNVNPLGMFRGCVPVLLQAPILLALYVVFAQSVELRGAPFMWITDLSAPDRLISWNTNLILIGSSFNLLPLIMAATNYIQMRVMRMPAADEMQERIQKQMTIMMPIMMLFFLYKLPSGLILYWIVSNIISIGQSIITKRIIASHMAVHEAQKKSQPSKELREGTVGI